MKHHRHLIFILTLALCSGLIWGCASPPEKTLKTKGFTLSYKDKTSAGSSVNKIQLSHPVKLSEADVRRHLRSLAFEELSLFGKKKTVFLTQDMVRIGRLLAKAIQRVPNHKIIHYELETSRGTTAGDLFASKEHIHWRFDSIKGINFSRRPNTSFGNTNWRMVPQPGQEYHAVQKLLGTQAQENWIIAELVPSKIKRSPRQKNTRQKSPQSPKNKTKALSRAPVNEDNSPAKSPDPALEKKFQFLKDLHEKNLIDEEEYDQKKKELLDTYL